MHWLLHCRADNAIRIGLRGTPWPWWLVGLYSLLNPIQVGLVKHWSATLYLYAMVSNLMFHFMCKFCKWTSSYLSINCINISYTGINCCWQTYYLYNLELLFKHHTFQCENKSCFPCENNRYWITSRVTKRVLSF